MSRTSPSANSCRHVPVYRTPINQNVSRILKLSTLLFNLAKKILSSGKTEVLDTYSINHCDLIAKKVMKSELRKNYFDKNIT